MLRDIQWGRICAAVAGVIVEDTPERLVTWTPDGSPLRLPADEDGRLVKSTEFHHLAELRWQAFGGPVFIYPAGESFSVRVSWDGPGEERRLDHWYVNLHAPLRRTTIGFDTADSVLDLVIQPDLANWHWKDEAEFEAAADSGHFTVREAGAIREAGLRTLECAQRRLAPFDEDWESWLPDPSWPIPELPEGWNRL